MSDGAVDLKAEATRAGLWPLSGRARCFGQALAIIDVLARHNGGVPKTSTPDMCAQRRHDVTAVPFGSMGHALDPPTHRNQTPG